MAYNLGWQRVINADPFVRGTIWVDELRREGNRVHFVLNASFAVEKAGGFWDYPWYLDWQLGNNHFNGRMIKGDTAWRQNIGGREFFISERNGHFRGFVDVGPQETRLVCKTVFYDNRGNRGHDCWWTMSIPASTPPGRVSSQVTDITSDSAKFSGRITSKGDYSNIKLWRLQWGKSRYNENTMDFQGDKMDFEHTLTGLEPSMGYSWRISVLNTTDHWSYVEGSFMTDNKKIGHQIKKIGETEESEILKLSGWAIFPNGDRKRIKKIRKIDPR